MEKRNLFKEVNAFCEENGLVMYAQELLLEKRQVKLSFEDSDGLIYSVLDYSVVKCFDRIKSEFEKQKFLNAKVSIKSVSFEQRFEKVMAFTNFNAEYMPEHKEYVSALEEGSSYDTSDFSEDDIMFCHIVYIIRKFLKMAVDGKVLTDLTCINNKVEFTLPFLLYGLPEKRKKLFITTFENIAKGMSIIFTETFTVEITPPERNTIIFATKEVIA